MRKASTIIREIQKLKKELHESYEWKIFKRKGNWPDRIIEHFNITKDIADVMRRDSFGTWYCWFNRFKTLFHIDK